MDLPVIVDNFGDTMIFRSAADAEEYLESQDVLANEYVAYDSQGRLLTLGVNDRGTVISAGEEYPAHVDTLRDLLIKYLTYCQGPQQELDTFSLEILVTKCLEHKYYSPPKESLIDNICLALPPILTWLLILTIPIWVGIMIHHHSPRWPIGISWLVGTLTFALCLLFAEWLLRGIYALFHLLRKPKD